MAEPVETTEPAADRPPPSGGVSGHRGIDRLLNLWRDLDDPQTIDENVHAGVELAGTNLWVLIFAVLVAAVGLNVNSAAVIVGAMLISPLMGPIVGLGYGLAVQDLTLMRRAGRNLLIFTLITLVTSTLYFAVSPLRVPGSELMARTSPTLWDVLIAFFGGAAGIIALTRKSIPNVIPGVAIATALMPALCTAGFGMSRGNWGMAGSAFYLYAINGTFIAFATYVFVTLMKLPKRGVVSERAKSHARLFTALTLVGVLIPSGYFAWRLVQARQFSAAATAQIDRLASEQRSWVIDHDLDPAARSVSLTLSGAADPDAVGQAIARGLAAEGFQDARIHVRASGGERVDMERLRRELREEVTRAVAEQLQARAADGAAPSGAAESRPHAGLVAALRARYPHARSIAVAAGEVDAASPTAGADGATAARTDALLVRITLPPSVHGDHQTRPQASRGNAEQEVVHLREWLAQRAPNQQILVDFDHGE